MSERLEIQGPYDLSLSVGSSDRFFPLPSEEGFAYRTVVRAEGLPALMDVRQPEDHPPVLAVAGSPKEIVGVLKPIATWMLFGELALGPFYEAVQEHAVLGDVVRRLDGLKPTRPPSLFEMAVTAVTEQQISMAAAYQIRSRVVETFGDALDVADDAVTGAQDDEVPVPHAFPTPETLASAPLEELEGCGLSRRKAEYIRGLAREVVEGAVDLEGLRELSNDEVRTTITELRGFGPWSADYILVRGLGRLDCAPADDLGVRTVVGRYLGDGTRMTAGEVEVALAPFQPYQGLVAFYLLTHSRLEMHRGDASEA